MQALRSLKKGEYFTKKPVEFPKESQVWVKGDYVRSLNAYECYKWEDINHITFISGKTMVNADRFRLLNAFCRGLSVSSPTP